MYEMLCRVGAVAMSCLHSYLIRSLQLSESRDSITGGVKMVQAQYSERFLKGEDIIEMGITKVKILDEGSYVKGNFGEQLQVRIMANDKDKTKFKWSLGSKANDQLIRTYGKDTAEWVGKEPEIMTEANKKGNPSVVVKALQGKLGVS
jgi:hypothetical protein